MKREKSNLDPRVYKYGAVCVSNTEKNQPRYLIDALWQMNNIWNQLVELGENQRIEYDEARRNASPEYQELAEALEKQNCLIDKAYEEKRAARAAASSRDSEHPKIKPTILKINQLKAERKELWETIRPIREKAGKLIDKSVRAAMNADFDEACKRLPKIENTDYLHSTSAQTVAKNFKDMRDTALKSNAKLRFHRFTGEGRFVYPLRKKGMSADGISFEELLTPDNLKNKDFIALTQHNKGKGTGKKSRIPVIRVKARIKGAPKRADYKYLEFDVILHRPIPEEGILSRVELVRKRQGDRFFWHACFTVRLPHAEPKKRAERGHRP